MRRRTAHGLAIAFLIVGLGAAQGPNNSEAKLTPGSSVTRISEVRKQAGKTKPYQVGTASWYGQNFEGKPTASGEPYEMYDMTAAHMSLPMGSYVQVTNLRNGKSVVVRVNYRGPIVPGRIIDLSYGAAQALQFRHKGLQRVRLDVVELPQSAVARSNGASKLSASKPAYETVAYNHPAIEQIH